MTKDKENRLAGALHLNEQRRLDRLEANRAIRGRDDSPLEERKLTQQEAAAIKIMLQKQDAALSEIPWDYDTAKQVFLGNGWPTSFKKWQATAIYLAEGRERPGGFMQLEATVQLKWKKEADFDILRKDFKRPPLPGTEFVIGASF